MAIRREKLPEVDSIVDRIVRHKEGYQAIERLTRVPWFAIAVIHSLEAGGDFNRHLHNGDPLTALTDWSVEHLAYMLEAFNGFGYRTNHPNVKSPYLWSYSNHYTKPESVDR